MQNIAFKLPRYIRLLPALAIAALLSACGTAPIPTNYAPSSVMSANGSLSVAEFTYLPAQRPTSPLPPNVIHNTAVGTVKIDKDVKQGNRVKKFVTRDENAESVLILESVGGDRDGRRHGLVRGNL